VLNGLLDRSRAMPAGRPPYAPRSSRLGKWVQVLQGAYLAAKNIRQDILAAKEFMRSPRKQQQIEWMLCKVRLVVGVGDQKAQRSIQSRIG
jgi:hypothetical protein